MDWRDRHDIAQAARDAKRMEDVNRVDDSVTFDTTPEGVYLYHPNGQDYIAWDDMASVVEALVRAWRIYGQS